MNLQAHSSTPRFERKSKPTARALRVRSVGSLDGWHFIITDTDGQIVARNLGALPAYYNGLRWTPAMAARRIKAHKPQSHVAMICTEPRASFSAKVRRAA